MKLEIYKICFDDRLWSNCGSFAVSATEAVLSIVYQLPVGGCAPGGSRPRLLNDYWVLDGPN